MKRAKKINVIRKFRRNRVSMRIVGTASRPRASVFRSNKFLYVQLIDDKKGNTLTAASSKKGVQAAEKLGLKISDLAKKVGIKEAVLDRAAYKYHGQVQKVTEGMRAGGLKI